MRFEEVCCTEIGNEDFPGGPVVKTPPASVADMDSTPGEGRAHVLWSDWTLCHNDWACAPAPGAAPTEPENRNDRSPEKPAHSDCRGAPARWRRETLSSSEDPAQPEINK